MIFVLNAGYLFMLVALTIRNILFLRIILISAQGLFIAYNLVTANYVVLMWNCLFLAINLFQVIVLLRRRRPVTIPEGVEDIYDDTFHDMSKREFLYFWQIGKERLFEEGKIVEEGSSQEVIMLILGGTASVMKTGREIAELSRGSFIAEMSFLSGDPASADVQCGTPVETITWSQENLANLKKLNFELWIKIQHVLSKDLVGKVRRTSSLLRTDEKD
ncbi:MAG: cyclic nucleotide-binding domain-containing protein [Spirochaetales bacterium]|jgi:CRP-like cAMP-binding protein|nr:cyclic nucleotide-binding domain-containing protein [Spirochaetales bacterium]